MDQAPISEEDVRRTLLELTAILENASVGILFTRDRIIQRCNPRIAEIFGYGTADELIGKPAMVLSPDEASYERLGREAGPLLGAGNSFHQRDWMGRKADGSPVWCTLYGKAVDPNHTDRGTVWVIEDITALRQTRREMEAIMQNAPVGIAFTRDRHFVRINPRWSEMFGYEGDYGVGLPARIAYRSDEEYEHIGRIAGPLLSAGKPCQTEMFMRRLDGTDFWANVIGYLQDPENPRAGTIWIMEDRTASKQAEADLRLAKERAEAASRAKSQFLANMSHELRTPLNAVLGYAQILRRGRGLSEKQSRALHTIQQSGEHLLTLINDILDLSRIEAGRLDLNSGAFDLAEFLKAIPDIVQVGARQKGIDFVYDASENLSRAVSGDENRLRQVLLNLLGNAVKFTDRGQVTLRVRELAGDKGQARLHFEIEDTGPGIAAEHLELIFLPFEQVGDLQRRSGGTGLGLAISRELVRMMGGDIHVESTPGSGSLFWFDVSLPVVDATAAASPARRIVSGYEGPRKKVLVIDDVAENRSVVTDLLRPLGFEVFEAADGREGLKQAQATLPDLILMDNVMPVMDGLEATRRLRQLPELNEVPIISMSASAAHSDQEDSLVAGASAFLPKPIAFDQLLDAIGALLHLCWNNRQREEGTIPEAESADP